VSNTVDIIMASSSPRAALALLCAATAVAAQREHSLVLNKGPEDYVNTLGGTKSRFDLSTGNILPEVQVPWGFNGWSPVTDTSEGSWFFYSESRRLYGIRCTHQPSPWITDWGSFTLMSQVVDDDHADSNNQFSAYSPASSTWSPHYFNASLLAYANRAGTAAVELTPTWHGAMLRFTFPPLATGPAASGYNQTRRVYIVLDAGGTDVTVGQDAAGRATLAGAATHATEVPADFAHHYYATVSDVNGNAVPLLASGSTGGSNPWAFLDYDPSTPGSAVLVVRVATSLISQAQAQANHANELGDSFDGTMADAKRLWHDELSRISVSDVGPGYTAQEEEDLLTVFYSCLYRAAKYPRNLWELEAETGLQVHWSPYNDKVNPGPLSTDNGFWDAYRTTYSLLELWRPAQAATALTGYLNAWLEGGWVPQWSSPGFRSGMTGTLSDVSFAEAIVKLPHCGTPRAAAAGYCINATAMYLASRQNAFETNVPAYSGRTCLAEYMQYGYIPWAQGCDAVVSRSLTYYHSDWAIAQAATLLGYSDDAALLLNRSGGWRNMLEPVTGFLQPKTAAGSFLPTFDEFAWGPAPGYTEAGPWQYRLEVPFDPAGLKAALGALGMDACDIVQEANTLPSAFHFGGYGSEIHEMTEMAELCWGQWEMNNQPVWALQHMQVAFDTSVTGKCASQAQKWLRQSTSLFKPGADMFSGDEDNGSMAAWHILNVLGLYPLSPASGDYVIGSPLFANVTITLDRTATQPLTVSALNQGPANMYVQGVTWRGAAVTGVSLSYADLMQGGVLQFTMGPAPATR